MEDTPTVVLIMVGHMQHKVTVIAEVRNDFENTGSLVTYTALTTIVTSGNQANGETGLNNCIKGLMIYLPLYMVTTNYNIIIKHILAYCVGYSRQCVGLITMHNKIEPWLHFLSQ